MRITLVGSRHFGVTTLNTLKAHGVEIVRVVVHDAEDRLAATAKAAGIEVVVQADPRLVAASEIAPDTDLIVTAHSHARVSKGALAAAKLGANDLKLDRETLIRRQGRDKVPGSCTIAGTR